MCNVKCPLGLIIDRQAIMDLACIIHGNCGHVMSVAVYLLLSLQLPAWRGDECLSIKHAWMHSVCAHTHTPKFLTAVKCNTHTQTQTHTHCDKSVSYSTSCSPHCCCVFLVARIHTHWRSSSPLVTHILFVPVRWHSVTNCTHKHAPEHTHTHTHYGAVISRESIISQLFLLTRGAFFAC